MDQVDQVLSSWWGGPCSRQWGCPLTLPRLVVWWKRHQFWVRSQLRFHRSDDHYLEARVVHSEDSLYFFRTSLEVRTSPTSFWSSSILIRRFNCEIVVEYRLGGLYVEVGMDSWSWVERSVQIKLVEHSNILQDPLAYSGIIAKVYSNFATLPIYRGSRSCYFWIWFVILFLALICQPIFVRDLVWKFCTCNCSISWFGKFGNFPVQPLHAI